MAVRGLHYVKSADRWQRYGEIYHDEARKYYSELNKTALTVATFLLGFIGIFLQIGNIRCEPLLNKVLLGVGFTSLTISSILGLFIFLEMNRFLNKAGDSYEQLSENLNIWMLKSTKESGAEYPKEIYKGINLITESNNTLSYIQLFLLGTGFIAVTIYFFFKLVM